MLALVTIIWLRSHDVLCILANKPLPVDHSKCHDNRNQHQIQEMTETLLNEKSLEHLSINASWNLKHVTWRHHKYKRQACKHIHCPTGDTGIGLQNTNFYQETSSYRKTNLGRHSWMVANERNGTSPHFPEETSHILMEIVRRSLVRNYTPMRNGNYLVRIGLIGT